MFSLIGIGGLVLAIGSAAAMTAQQQRPSPQAQVASVLRELSACEVTKGQLLGLQADVIDGTLVNWATVKQMLEQTNPSLVLDLATKKLSAKAAP